MTKSKRDQDWGRAVEADEAAQVRGGDGKTKTPPKTTTNQEYMEFKLKDDLVSGS